MQFSDGATASLSMIAFTESVCTREVNVFGTKVNFVCFNQGILFPGSRLSEKSQCIYKAIF
jgi:hypothetical protein